MIQERGDWVRVERGGGDDQFEVGPQVGLHISEHGQCLIDMDGSLMKFIEDDGTDVIERRVALEPPVEDSFGHDEQAGLLADATFHPNLIADRSAERPMVFGGDTGSDGAGGNASGLKHNHAGVFFRQYVGGEKRWRDACGFAGAGGCEHHECVVILQVRDDLF